MASADDAEADLDGAVAGAAFRVGHIVDQADLALGRIEHERLDERVSRARRGHLAMRHDHVEKPVDHAFEFALRRVDQVVVGFAGADDELLDPLQHVTGGGTTATGLAHDGVEDLGPARLGRHVLGRRCGTGRAGDGLDVSHNCCGHEDHLLIACSVSSTGVAALAI